MQQLIIYVNFTLYIVRPVETRLIASELGAMTADVEYEVRCETAGAQPAAVISWWINGNIRLKDFVNKVRGRERERVCQKSRKISCVIPRCKLQRSITQPIL